MNNKEIFELVGIGCVVLSLMFVGYEIRQNTNVARSTAYQEFHLNFSDWNLSTGTNEVLLEVIEKTRVSGTIENLNASEQFTLFRYYTSTLRLWAGLYYPVQAGILPESTLDAIGRGGLFRNSVFVELWPRLKISLDVSYVQFIEGKMNQQQN